MFTHQPAILQVMSTGVSNYPLPVPSTIMIYDPDLDLVDMICLALEMENFVTFGICDGNADFLQLIQIVKPDLLLFGFTLTGKYSIAWCRAIKLLYPHLPILALSCNNNIGEVYSDCGFDDCISKPFNLEELYASVKKHAACCDLTIDIIQPLLSAG